VGYAAKPDVAHMCVTNAVLLDSQKRNSFRRLAARPSRGSASARLAVTLTITVEHDSHTGTGRKPARCKPEVAVVSATSAAPIYPARSGQSFLEGGYSD